MQKKSNKVTLNTLESQIMISILISHVFSQGKNKIDVVSKNTICIFLSWQFYASYLPEQRQHQGKRILGTRLVSSSIIHGNTDLLRDKLHVIQR